VNGKCGGADDGLGLSVQPDTKRERSAADPNHYPWLQCLMKTHQTIIFILVRTGTIMVSKNYRIVIKLGNGIKCKFVYTGSHFSVGLKT